MLQSISSELNPFPVFNKQMVPGPTAEKIGLLGSIFDPIHFGHLSIAQLAFEHLSLDRVLFIPAGDPPHKQDKHITEAKHRLAMLKRAISNVPHFSIWKDELERPGLSYTIDTLSVLSAQNPQAQFYFIIGSDNLPEMLTWNRFQEIARFATLCVAHRPGYSFKIPVELRQFTIKKIPSPEWGISSSQIRSYVKKSYSCTYLVPEKVLEYIQTHKLYC